MPIDPNILYNNLFSGLGIGVYSQKTGLGTPLGSLGCFVKERGDNQIFLLSCQHVLYPSVATVTDFEVFQPGYFGMKPDIQNYIGNYVRGICDNENDCAIATLIGRNYSNEVPTSNDSDCKAKLTCIDTGKTGDEVYKFGCRSGYTTGFITNVENNKYTITSNEFWAFHGDSGSLLMRKRDNAVLGLNYEIETDGGPDAGKVGYAYDLSTQLYSLNVDLIV